MPTKSQGINVSFPLSEREEIEKRVRELKLPERGGLSQYFQLLRDLDARMQFVPHYHKADGKLHFYPETEPAELGSSMSNLLMATTKRVLAEKDAAAAKAKSEKAGAKIRPAPST